MEGRSGDQKLFRGFGSEIELGTLSAGEQHWNGGIGGILESQRGPGTRWGRRSLPSPCKSGHNLCRLILLQKWMQTDDHG